MGEGMRNKIRKKILSLLLAGILAAGLCGCGQEAETQKTRVAMIVKSTESAFWKSVLPEPEQQPRSTILMYL